MGRQPGPITGAMNMESTFKKAYEKEILPDDSIKLTFREGPIEAHQISLFTALAMGYLFILLWVWLLIAAGLVWVLGEKSTAGLTSLVVVAAGVLLLRKKLAGKSAVIILKKEGIVFGGKQLAFKDVSKFGITTETVSGQLYTATAYIYAYAGGREIRITRHMKPALAQALLDEIKRDRVA
jgi:hypothetical protein